MALLLYTYSVTSIRAAKRNAQLHREADGGQLDMRRESLRRHGVLEKVPQTGGVQLFRAVRGGGTEEGRMARDEGQTMMGEKKARKLRERGRERNGELGEEQENRRPRTAVEGRLEGYKGKGRALERFREEPPQAPEG
jgi:hypothetical protein